VKKFRVWDEQEKKMYSAEELNKTMLKITFDGRIVSYDDDEEANLKLLQYVGLNDKDGNPICEGDIVHLQWIHNYTGSIEYRNGSFCMVCAHKELIVRAIGELYSENIRVIGNVYENADLLAK